MKTWRKFEVSQEAIDDAKRLSLFGDVEKRIARMATRSAPFTHPDGNRRFLNFVFRIEDGCILSCSTLDTV